tara:strand:- start:241 stop:402 length:162 start_codon:yes stop_codon:yes gene_type:complete
MTSSKTPKNWSDWNDAKHFSDYSKGSRIQKVVSYGLFALIFIPVGFLGYMTTI